MLWKGVTREVRLSERAKAGDPSGTGKLMPLGFGDGPKLHFTDDAAEQIPQDRRVTQRPRRASERFHNPFDSTHGGGGVTPGAFRIPDRI